MVVSALDFLMVGGVEAALAAGAAGDARLLEPVIDYVAEVGVVLLVVGVVMCLVRVLRGPHLADRVMGVEILALNVVGIVILLSIYLASAAFLDVALVVAIIGFTSVIAFAQYIDAMRRRRVARRQARQEENA